MIDNPDIATDELTNIVKGPDFPTGGIIFGRQAIKQAYSDGRGRIVVRARSHVEEIAQRPRRRSSSRSCRTR